MHVIYEEITNIRQRKVLIYCPYPQPKSKNIIGRLLQSFKPKQRKFFWIAKIQTEKVVDRSYNLKLIKSLFFTRIEADSEES
ncbi:hypothetical protein I4641_15730 [Waterburya agarophytonicola K14]|uniref:Uncharacterized protein n=1 Tax=Waterburya agarophytonicola KI4 TaxID=2874699 RepID=A0A964BUK6_9CYAN|nr:hypothetical protein [Waterburya agarophytonicola]MCC0178427.1 hypothetical protein [Waterburya agarophytonicola KI4]